MDDIYESRNVNAGFVLDDPKEMKLFDEMCDFLNKSDTYYETETFEEQGVRNLNTNFLFGEQDAEDIYTDLLTAGNIYFETETFGLQESAMNETADESHWLGIKAMIDDDKQMDDLEKVQLFLSKHEDVQVDDMSDYKEGQVDVHVLFNPSQYDIKEELVRMLDASSLHYDLEHVGDKSESAQKVIDKVMVSDSYDGDMINQITAIIDKAGAWNDLYVFDNYAEYVYNGATGESDEQESRLKVAQYIIDTKVSIEDVRAAFEDTVYESKMDEGIVDAVKAGWKKLKDAWDNMEDYSGYTDHIKEVVANYSVEELEHVIAQPVEDQYDKIRNTYATMQLSKQVQNESISEMPVKGQRLQGYGRDGDTWTVISAYTAEDIPEEWAEELKDDFDMDPEDSSVWVKAKSDEDGYVAIWAFGPEGLSAMEENRKPQTPMEATGRTVFGDVKTSDIDEKPFAWEVIDNQNVVFGYVKGDWVELYKKGMAGGDSDMVKSFIEKNSKVDFYWKGRDKVKLSTSKDESVVKVFSIKEAYNTTVRGTKSLIK
jgi:hypothetical protein